MIPPGLLPHAELLLVLGLFVFYLHDAARLLHFDDLIVSGRRRGWDVTADAGLEVRGRFLWLPSPLLPMRAQFRAGWLHAPRSGGEAVEAAASVDSARDLDAFVRPLWPIRVGCMLVAVCLLVALPAILLGGRDPVQLLAVLATSYLLTLAMLLIVLRRRRVLGWTRRQLAGLAAEALLCPPYAINLFRRLCQHRGLRGDPLDFAARTLDREQQQRLRRDIERRLSLLGLVDDQADAPDASPVANAASAAGDRTTPEGDRSTGDRVDAVSLRSARQRIASTLP